jgi:very-short-patch-repair endonuclease
LEMRGVELCHQYGSYAARQAWADCQRWFQVDGRPISPIERLMACSLILAIRERAGVHHKPRPDLPPVDVDATRWPAEGCDGYWIYWQVRLDQGRYIVDFFVNARVCGFPVTAVIECDGHDYHERTKDQASYDKARDRFCQANGHLVLRYTGSDIWGDPLQHAEDALKTIDAVALARKAA